MEEGIHISTEIEQYEKKIYDQKQLIHISKALNSNLELHSLIESILNICLAQAQTFQIGIYLNPELTTNSFTLHSNSIGFELNESLTYELDSGSDLLQFLNESNRTYTLADLKAIPELQDKQIKKDVTQLESLSADIILIPLRAKGKLNGIIVLGPKTDGTEHTASEKGFLADLASIAAIAVENARLYELATVDMMTRLKIHHYFQTKLRDEIEISKISGRPLSMYMTDIDHFKTFNDTFGHQLGDTVLMAVADQLISNSRSSDIPSRYGGEEFTVILPNTNLQEAKALAERTRKAVEKMQVDNPQKEESLSVTISIGVAQYNPVVDAESKIFIERCDKALYKAKDAGRNRVEIATG